MFVLLLSWVQCTHSYAGVDLLTYNYVCMCVCVCCLLADGMEAETASVTVLEQLPEPVLNDLRQIAGWLLCCGYDTDFMQVYATVRSPLLVKSLHTYVTPSPLSLSVSASVC